MVSSNKQPIVQATDRHIDLLDRLIRRSFADVARRFDLTPKNCPRHPSNYTREWIEEDLTRGVHYFFLMANDTAVGCVGVERAPQTSTSDTLIQNHYMEVYMERLAVLPQHRSKGFGTRLARHAMSQAQAMGANQVGIGIIAADTGLKGFYKHLGFKQGETKTFPHLPFEVSFMHYSL